jgi:glutathione S-transferase
MLARSPMGKVPYLAVDGGHLCESQVICEFLEDKYPENPLYPKDALARARVRELITVLELHIELVGRRLYSEAFFGGSVSDEVKKQVEKDLVKGVRAFKQLAKFSPYAAGSSLSLADCAAAVHLPLASLATKIIYGRDVLDDYAPVKPYLKMINERPAFRKMNDERKVAMEAMAAAKAKKG